MTTRQEVIERFCQLSSEVMERAFNNQSSADCFCEKQLVGFCFEEKVMSFIEDAVKDKLESLQTKQTKEENHA